MKWFFIILIFNVGCVTAKVSSLKKEQKIEVETLPNGASIIWVKDNSVPLVDIAMVVKSGAVSDPMAQSGLTNLMLNTWMENSKLAEKFAVNGTHYEQDISNDFFIIGTSGLSEKKEELTELFFKLIKQPQFNATTFEIKKQQIISGMKKIPDDPEMLSLMVFRKYIYGAHPYGRATYGEESDIKKMTLKQVVAHYNKVFLPQQMIFIVCGDFSDDFKKLFISQVSDIKQKPTYETHKPHPPEIKHTQILLIDKPDVEQAQILLGQFSVEKKNDDFEKLNLAQTILGGTFTSRLNQKIRVDKGLTYDIHSELDSDLSESVLKISTSTKNENVKEVISDILNTLQDFIQNGVTSEELEVAQNYRVGKLIRSVETPDGLAVWMASQMMQGLKPKTVNDGISEIRDVSTGKVNRAIKKYMSPTKLKIVIVAPAKKVMKGLQGIGLVEVQKATRY